MRIYPLLLLIKVNCIFQVSYNKVYFESLTSNIHQMYVSFHLLVQHGDWSKPHPPSFLLRPGPSSPQKHTVTTKCHSKCTEPVKDFLPRSYMSASNQNFILEAIKWLSNKLLFSWRPSTRRTVIPALKRKEIKRNPSVLETLTEQTNIIFLFSYWPI